MNSCSVDVALPPVMPIRLEWELQANEHSVLVRGAVCNAAMAYPCVQVPCMAVWHVAAVGVLADSTMPLSGGKGASACGSIISAARNKQELPPILPYPREERVKELESASLWVVGKPHRIY